MKWQLLFKKNLYENLDKTRRPNQNALGPVRGCSFSATSFLHGFIKITARRVYCTYFGVCSDSIIIISHSEVFTLGTVALLPRSEHGL
jgi:hypothetical protein